MGLTMASIFVLFIVVCQIQFDDSKADRSSRRFFYDQAVQGFAELANESPIWSTPCEKTNSSPVIVGNKVLLLERLNREAERVRCFRLDSGQPVWEHRYDAPLPSFFDDEYGWGPHSTPTTHEGNVITVGVTGIVWAIEIESGKTLWRRDLWQDFQATELERGVAATPVVESGQMIIPLGGVGSGIVSLSLDNGKTLWGNTNFKAAYASPTVGELGGQRQVVALMHDVLCGLEPETGRLLWQFPFQVVNTVHVASPLIIDQQYVLAGSSSGGTRLLTIERERDRWRVEQVWQTNRSSPQVGNFLKVKDQVIAPASGGSANITVCLNLQDGTLAWKERFGGRGNLIGLRDGIVTLNEKGDLEIRRLQPTESKEVFRFPGFANAPHWSSPVFADHLMVIQSGETLQARRLGRFENSAPEK